MMIIYDQLDMVTIVMLINQVIAIEQVQTYP